MKNRYIPPVHFDRILRASPKEDRALWILASETGFRIDDLLSIRQWEVPSEKRLSSPFSDENRPTLTLIEAKTDKKRSVLLSDRALEAISEIWRNCPKKHPFKFLFPSRLTSGEPDTSKTNTKKKKKLHRSTAHRHFAKAVKKAGLTGRGYTVHSLRKIYARNLYEKTRSVLAVQRDLGHAVTATTLLYVSDLEL